MKLLRFFKPYGVLTQFTDPDGRSTLADYIQTPGIYAAGRLDRDSEGLLLLTDSGWANARLTQPGSKMPKTYWVQVEGEPGDEALMALRRGVLLNDGMTLPARADRIDPPPLPERDPPIRHRAAIPTTWLEIVLTEGRNRQVRRMTAAVGHPTLRLVRWAIGPVTLEGLVPGQAEAVPVHLGRELLGPGPEAKKARAWDPNRPPPKGSRRKPR